jgi:hypothetical protein
MLEPAVEMPAARLRAGPAQALGAARRPAAHHVISPFGVELQRDRPAAEGKGLVGEILAEARAAQAMPWEPTQLSL